MISSSSGKVFDDLGKRRPVAFLAAARRTADVDEPDDALVRSKPEGVEHAPVVGIPFGDPARRKPERVRRMHQVHGRGAGGEHLLPLGYFHVRRGAAHHGNDQRRARQPATLELDLVGGRFGMIGLEAGGDRFTGGEPGVALEHDEAPRNELAVIGHPRRDRQQGLKLGRGRDRAGKIDGLHRAGFDVATLMVQWQKKWAYPLMAPVSMLLAIPFAFLVGTRGAIGGVALGVGIGVAYWAIAKLLDAMGGVGQLPPFLAGWSPDIVFFFLGLYFFFKMPT